MLSFFDINKLWGPLGTTDKRIVTVALAEELAGTI
jgi:hypothetical protein